MTGVFDRFILAQLLYKIREIKIPELIVKWVGNIIRKRTKTLCLPGYNYSAFPMHTSILQGSPLLSIFFLFYNSNIVLACNFLTDPASGTGFVVDVNALVLGKSTEENCRMLQTVHEQYSEWARRHRALFAPEEHIIVHFTKANMKHNNTCSLTLPTSTNWGRHCEGQTVFQLH
jgi:hypothetical protein